MLNDGINNNNNIIYLKINKSGNLDNVRKAV